MNSRDFPLPISSAGAAHASPWPRVESEPVNLIAIVPGEAPSQEQVISALSAVAKQPFSIVDHPEPRPPSLWNVLVAGPALSAPIVVWCEPMRPLSAETVKFLKAEQCQWAIGIETVLEYDEPQRHLQQIIRILGRAFPQAPAILNVNTSAWYTREELDNVLMQPNIPVSPSLTFLVHAIGPEARDPAHPPSLWAYTDGLRVTGRPELEMHGIAVEDGRIASNILNTIAEMVVELGLPAPGERFEIGVGLAVRFLPWEQAAAAAPDDALGSMSHRIDHAERQVDGVRAAVCAMDSLMWPAEAARALQRGETALYKTLQATQREATVARHTLDRFTQMFQSVPATRRKDTPDRVAAFVVKAGFAVPGHAADEDDHEHLWFEAAEIRNGRVRGTLLNEPTHVNLRRGDQTWIDRQVVSDWQIFTPRGQFGPLQHAAAKMTIEQLLTEPARA